MELGGEDDVVAAPAGQCLADDAMRWSPAGTICSVSTRSRPATPSSAGSPPGRRCQRVGSAKRSTPLVANVVARGCCSAPRKCPTAVRACSKCGHEEVVVPMPNEISGGSSESEVSEVAVKPTGPRPASVVMTTTPAGYWRNAFLKRSGRSPPGRGRGLLGTTARSGSSHTQERSATSARRSARHSGIRPAPGSTTTSTSGSNMSSSRTAARPTSRARRRNSATARASAASARASRWGKDPVTGPWSAARRTMARSETSGWRHPVRPHEHGFAPPDPPAPSGRWATLPAPERGPRCMAPSVAKAASTTAPTKSRTVLVRVDSWPDSCSARARAREWLSTWAGSPVAAASRSRAGTSCQPSCGCATITPLAGSTRWPVARPRARTVRPPACSATGRGNRAASPASSRRQVLGGGDGRGVCPARGSGTGLGDREGGGPGRRGRGASGAVTHGGAHTLQVDMTPRRQVCGSLHASQRTRTGATRSNHRRIMDSLARDRTFSGIHL